MPRLKGKARKEAKAALTAPIQPAEPAATHAPLAPLAPRCGVCGKSDGLFYCVNCEVIQYCSKNHQTAHRPDHGVTCNRIKKAQLACAKEEEKLRNLPADMFFAANPFENSVGHFWGILETRDYMRARHVVVDAILKVKSFEAVQAAYDSTRDLLRLCRSDNMGVRDLVPSLLMRLGRDQDAYDFLKWYLTEGERSDYDWGNMSLPFLNVVNADVFEPVDLVCKRFSSLSNQVDIMLLKVRLLLELQDLQGLNVNATGLKRELPQEVIDLVRDFVPKNSIISGNKEIMESKDHSFLIDKLENQIDTLFEAARATNRHFWPALLNPGNHLAARPDFHSMGSIQEMQLVLQYTFDAWNETPGAIDVIRMKMGSL